MTTDLTNLLILEILTTLLAVAILIADLFGDRETKARLGWWAVAGLAGILVYSAYLPSVGWHPVASGEMFVGDGFALYCKRLFLVAGIFVCVMSIEFSWQLESGVGEFFALILFALTGMMLAASANDFILLFVSLELITITFYVLTSYLRRQVQSLEAGVKYLILGAISSAFLVYGIAYVFGHAGATNFGQIAAWVAKNPDHKLLMLGVVLVFAGLGFKIAAVPFQVWTPDVYQGAPASVAAFLAVGSKAAGFVLLLRVFMTGLLDMKPSWQPLFAGIAAATILYGNLGAIPQRNIKRLLGYSSIGHAGFMLMGVAAGSSLGVKAVLFYLGAYLFTTLGAFMIVIVVSNTMGDDDIDAYRGLAKRAPMLAWAMAIAMASLAGIPPLAGFFGKFLVFAAAIESHLYWLAAIGLIGVGASLYFYLGVIRAMFWEDSQAIGEIAISRPMRVALLLVAVATVVIGVFQGPLTRAAVEATNALGLK